MNKTQWAMLLTLSVLWGGSFFFVGVAVQELPPLSIVAARLGLAAIALNIIVLATGQKMPAQWRLWAAFGGMGLLNNAIPFSLIVWGQTQIASGLAAIFNAATPLFSVIVAHMLSGGDEKITPARLFGVVAGFIGVAIMIGADALAGLGDAVFAQLAILGAACSYAFAAVFGLRFRRQGIAPLITASGQVTAGAIFLIPLMLLIDRPWALPAISSQTIAALTGLALLSTALAYLIYFRILASAGATNVALVTFLVPLSAILLGALFLGEILKVEHFYGMILIGVGLAAIDGRAQKFLQQTLRRHTKKP